MTTTKLPRVVLIEPDGLLAGMYEKALTLRGIETQITSSAGGALGDIDEFKPDAIVLELQLQSNNGIEFLHELRSYADWQAIPIVVNTVVPQGESGIDDNVMRRLYITNYCYKPRTKLSELANIIEGLVRNK